ncbi:MAG: carboxypeptidase regulatory-like domain-containing protein [Vicinamibacterales bacterium]
MDQRFRIVLGLLVAAALFVAPSGAAAQGVTTGSINGIVKDAQGLAVPGSTVLAVHQPSGSTYEAVTREDGRFSIPGMRIGGPYTVTAALEGFQPSVTSDVFVNLGVTSDLTLTLMTLAVSEEVTVVAQSDAVFSSARTGASTAISRETLASLPTVGNRLQDFTRLTPQAAGTSFGGVDNRLNNITVDGSYFNNSFGLAGSPGDRTGVAPISLSAIEAVQVNIAPYDVRQGNFVGAGVNSVTRSGSNSFRGSAFYQWRNEGLVGTEAKGLAYDPGTFDFHNGGGWVSGPIIKNKLFFFFNFEDEANTYPGTTFKANSGSETVAGNTTRVLASDLQALSSYMKANFGYETGPYEGYQFETPARRYLFRGDYNLNSTNKISFRYNQLDSNTDVLMSNSSSLGFGNRRTNLNAMNFEASNYQIKEDILSFIGEWNGAFGGNMANTLIVGYTKQDESRDVRYPTLFPLVDILKDGTTYTSVGYEPFTPNNELRYNTFQLQDNFSVYLKGHSLTFGGSYEAYESENVFFPGKQSAYIYNSLSDFYADANDYLANPNRTTSPVTLRRFQVRWNNIPGNEKPVQPLEVQYLGAYVQDVWQAKSNFSVTYGLRFDVPIFGDTGYANAVADAMTFMDENGDMLQYSTAKLPDANLLWSPRVGFNWDVFGDRNTQLRGGTGVFTGKPAYVWISNQIGNTGVLTGFAQFDNTTARPFNPDTEAYKPTSVTGAPASSFELALTDPNFQFPQVWRTSIGLDQRLPGGWVGTVEYLYSKDVNGVYYINANLPNPNSAYVGADTRPRWVGSGSNRINGNVSNAVVMKNQDVGTNWNISGSLERTYRSGLYLKGGYRYGRAWNTVDPGSIAFGSWNNNQHSFNPNLPGVAYSASSPGHRVFAAGSYTFEWLKALSTSVSVFFEGYTQGNPSYTFSGDANGDGGTSNDLLYIPRDQSEMNFQTYTSSGVTYTAAEQAAAWETYIAQDNYLSEHRGEYAVRGAVFLPMVFRTDLSISQDIFKSIAGRRNSLQFRVDIANFGNLLNSDWGVGQRLVNAQPLISPSADATGRMQYRLRAVNNKLMTESLQTTAGFSDVYSVMFSLRYQF